MKYLNVSIIDSAIFTFIFFIASFIGILHHELWLDEAHHWLLARDSSSLSNLIANIKYEGHPVLWNILLFYITRFSSNPFWMQLLHIIISSSVVFIFFKNAPFSKSFKILFIFGYFMFFEYNLLSRNYAIGLLFLFLACSIYQYRKEKFILFAIFLAMANNTHAIFIIITSCLMFIICIECIQKHSSYVYSKVLFGLTIFALGTLIALIQIIPPSDTSFFENVNELSYYQKIPKTFMTLFKGVFTIPDFRTISFWNTNLIVNLNKPFAAILGALSFLIPCALFYKNKIILFYVYLGILGSSLFFFVTQLSAPRYFGLNYLIIISGLWINHYHPFTKNKLNSLFSITTNKKIKERVLYSILIIQLFSGVITYSMDIIKPFSNSKQTIEYLERSGNSHKTITTIACDGTALSSYLQRPLFFISYNKYQSYCSWGRKNSDVFYSKKSIIKSFVELLNTENKNIIFISNSPYLEINTLNNWTEINEKIKYKFLKKFEESIINKGNYYIYEISLNNKT